MDNQQNTNQAPGQTEQNTQTPVEPNQPTAPAATASSAVIEQNVQPVTQQPASPLQQPKEKFQLYYIQDSVVSLISVGKARFCEIFFGLIFLISVLMVKAALTPSSYKHFNSIVAYVYSLSGIIISFIIFFVLLSAYTHKKAGKQVSSTYRKLPSSLLLGVIGAQIGIVVNDKLQSSLSADMNTYVLGAIGGFMGVMCLSFIIVMHETVKKIRSYR